VGLVNEPVGLVNEPVGLVNEPVGSVNEPVGSVNEPVGSVNERALGVAGRYFCAGCAAAVAFVRLFFFFVRTAALTPFAALRSVRNAANAVRSGLDAGS